MATVWTQFRCPLCGNEEELSAEPDDKPPCPACNVAMQPKISSPKDYRGTGKYGNPFHDKTHGVM